MAQSKLTRTLFEPGDYVSVLIPDGWRGDVVMAGKVIGDKGEYVEVNVPGFAIHSRRLMHPARVFHETVDEMLVRVAKELADATER